MRCVCCHGDGTTVDPRRAPYNASCYDLLTDTCVEKGNTARIVKEPRSHTAGGRAAESVFARLEAAGRRLMAVIGRNRGGANKDLAKFADQIDALCNKWER